MVLRNLLFIIAAIGLSACSLGSQSSAPDNSRALLPQFVVQNNPTGGSGGTGTATPTPAPFTATNNMDNLPIIADVRTTNPYASFCVGGCGVGQSGVMQLPYFHSGNYYTAIGQCFKVADTSATPQAQCLWNQVAAIPGYPLDHPGQNCAGSQMGINESIPKWNAPGQFTNVVDINSVWLGSTNVGWMYKGSDGVGYVQANYSTRAGISFGVSVGFASVSVTTPGGYSGITHWDGNHPAGYDFHQCFTKGITFV